jgi:Zn-dependent peptidase ImmA (M78 family)
MEGDNVEAFSFWSGLRPFIFMASEKEAGVRLRYDLSHELGHLILHRWIEKSELEDKATLKEVEAEADRFAGAFLLPSTSFPNEVYTTRLDAFLPLKERWKVSPIQVRSATVQHRRHGGVNGRGKGRGQGL